MIRWLWILLFGHGCEHAWALLTDREFSSKLEVARGTGCSVYIGDIPKLSERTYYAIVKCDKCGAIKEFSIRA